jgi:hypothetical protein
VHPVIISLKKRIEKATASEKYDIILTKMAPTRDQSMAGFNFSINLRLRLCFMELASA